MEEAILAGDAPLASSRVTDKKLARQLKGDLDAILAKAIKRDPNERYTTADALAADIQRYLDGHAIEARPDSTWYRLRKAVIRHKVPVLAASVVLVVALIGLTTTLVQGQRAADEAERARLTTAFVSELFRLNATQQAPMTDGAARARPAVFVDRGAQLIEQQFEKRPELKAEMYGVAGRTYADLGVDRPAIEYAKLQLATLRAQGANTQHIAKALMLLAEVSLTAERNRDAEEHSRRAVESLPQGDALLPEALALLARAQVRIVKWAEARKSVDEARRLLGAGRTNGSPAAASLLNVETELASFEGKFDEAALLFERSIEEAIAAQGPLSRAAIDMRLWRAEQLIYKLKPQEALVHRDAAYHHGSIGWHLQATGCTCGGLSADALVVRWTCLL
jgi:serine/threonine-protein kinase